MGNKQLSEAKKYKDHFVVEVLSATGVPKGDLLSQADAYVKIWVKGSGDARKGTEERTLRRRNTASPIWNAHRDLHCAPSKDDVLHVEIWDYDVVSKDEMLAKADIPLSELSTEPKEHKMESIGSSGEVPVLIRLRLANKPVTRKTLFLIRHGESKWNAATQIGEMLHFDHGLNQTGVDQAKSLNAAWKKTQEAKSNKVGDISSRFLSESCWVYASPLTRASQTAVLSLKDHPALKASGKLHLLWTIREAKSLGGLDTIGQATGDEIHARVLQELAEITGQEEASACMVPFEVGACSSEWWTTIDSKDSEDMLEERLDDLVCTLQCAPFESTILVGHSYLWRYLVRRCLASSKKWCRRNPQLAEALGNARMQNGACLGLELDFASSSSRAGAPEIVQAQFLFGTSYLADEAGSPNAAATSEATGSAAK